MILNFSRFEPDDSYKNNSYKKNITTHSQIKWDISGLYLKKMKNGPNF